ncbi:MAG TPA: FxsA family protein [Acidimicrobiales bacterium]
MALLLVLVFLVAPLVELAVIIQVGASIGALNTVGLLVAVSLVGAWLATREGLGVLRRIQAALDQGRLPDTEVADGGLILLAGALMIAPGFISDAVAILLLLPPTRALVRVPLMRWVARRGPLTVTRMTARRGPAPGAGDVWDVESWETTPRSPTRGELGEAP